MDGPSLYDLASVLQQDLISAVQKVIPRSSWRVPLPWCFGSRKYSLAGPSSDVDFLAVIPNDLAAKSHDLRASLAGILLDKGVLRNRLRGMKDLETLRWSLPGVEPVREVSLLLTSKPLSQLRVTIFLRDFYATYDAYMRVVFSVTTKLRSVCALNSHGSNAIAGQSLKTAFVALW